MHTARSMAGMGLAFIIIVTPWTCRQVVTACTGAEVGFKVLLKSQVPNLVHEFEFMSKRVAIAAILFQTEQNSSVTMKNLNMKHFLVVEIFDITTASLPQVKKIWLSGAVFPYRCLVR